MSEAIDYNALGWVQQELGEVLRQARTLLEEYSEKPDDKSCLQECAKCLHQARGPLQMVGLKGADKLASEMEEVIADLLHATLSQPETALDVLMQAFLQLPDYLSRLNSGNADVPVALLPVINNLREVRGVAALAERAVFSPDLNVPVPPMIFTASMAVSEKEIQTRARASRVLFQAGLLVWYRSVEGNNGLQTLLGVLGQLKENAARESVARLWWVAISITEAMIAGDIPQDKESKQMFGELDRQIKRLVDLGESVFDDPLTDDLMKRQLYRVATTVSSRENIQLIKAHYELDKFMEHSVGSTDDDSLSGCSDELLKTVSATVIEDIEHIKDMLDIFTRASTRNPESLSPAAGSLHALGNMLGMIGLDELGNGLVKKGLILSDVASGICEIQDPELMAIAHLLVAVEDAVHNLGGEATASENVSADRLFLQEGMQAITREAMTDMARVKDVILEYIKSPEDFNLLTEVPVILSRIRGSLQISGQGRAAIAIGQVQQFIAEELVSKNIPMDENQLEFLADAVCSIEYYIEESGEGRDEGDRVLGLAEKSLDALGYACPQFLPEEDEATFEHDELSGQPLEHTLPLLDDVAVSKPADSLELSVITELQVLDIDADAEILEIFIEEANEVLTQLAEQLPAWIASVDVEHPLVEARRGFHTIKGSGRMVGALALGEFAWAFENLLNKVIDGTVEVSDELLDLLGQPVTAMTQLLEQVGNKDAVPQIDVNMLARHAMMLSQPGIQYVEEPEDFPAQDAVEEPQVDVQEPVVCNSVLVEGSDPEILEIYLEEASEEIASLVEMVPQWIYQPDNAAVSSTVCRSLHTLKGSGRMAGAMAIGEFSWAFENLFNKTIDGSLEASESVFILMGRVPAALQQLFEQLRDGIEPAMDLAAMVVQAEALSRGETIELAAETDTALAEICEVELPAAEDQPVDEASADDTELRDIFVKECNEHLLLIEEFISTNHAPCHVTEPLYRSLHTISGISNSAAISSISHLTDVLDGYFDGLFQGNYLADSAALVVLHDCAVEIKTMVDQLPVMDIDAGIQQQLCARIEALPRTGEPPPVEDPYAEVDTELFEVFLEEAVEIIDAGENTLRAWSEEPGSDELMVEFQRQLHTLKGGARMVGIVPIGDLSHTLESLMTRIADGEVEATPEIFELLHDAHDHFSAMLEQVKSREVPAESADLIAVIEGVGLAVDEAVDEAPCDTLVEDGIVEAPEPESEVASIELDEIVPETDSAPEPEHDLVEPVIEEIAQDTSHEPLQEEVAEATEIVSEAVKVQKINELPPVIERRMTQRTRGEQVRVRADLLDNMVNHAGEINIYRARMEQQISDYRYNLGELDQTISRLREQLRQVEMETEAHILFRYEHESEVELQGFDPLEMDRYSNLQQLSRSLIESIGDLRSIQELMEGTTRESETLLLQQSRVSTDLQEGLLRSRMIPFSGLAPRLRRILRQSSRELGKKVELNLEGADGEMDRTVIERIIAPLEHMLRNAVAHGIEDPATRKQLGKPATGSVTISFDREGSEIVLLIEDDGAGLDIDAIRARAVERNLLDANAQMSDNDIMQFVLQTGFSTATEVTQISGRGVGMDVVNGEVKQLGGSLHISSMAGAGSVFSIRLPYTLAINQALLVKAGEETFCVPLGSVEGVARISHEELSSCYQSDDRFVEYAGNDYQLKHLASLLGCGGMESGANQRQVPVLLVRLGEKRVALQLESILGSREIVIKPLGIQLSKIEGISGATILGDGSVVLILDVMSLSRMQGQTNMPEMMAASRNDERLHVMVVDDSITVRKVTSRLLERNGFIVQTAKDGVDAMGQLQDIVPDMMLLDIEMPRMDGFELATHMRNDDRLRHVPIIMITSRTGDKHRDHAQKIGVNGYLGKPYQEKELLASIQALVDTRKTEECA